MRAIAVLICLITWTHSTAGAKVLLRVEGGGAGRNVLDDPSFEQTKSGWNPYAQGFRTDTAIRRSGKSSIVCENPAADSMSGTVQTVVLNQESAQPIRASVWSRAKDVAPAGHGDYSLYLDVQYADGSWLWAEIFDFHAGTHGWQFGNVIVYPERPVRKVNVHLLLRRCTGKAWFDDCHLDELAPSEGQALFDSTAVRELPYPQRSCAAKLRTLDGLEIALADDGSLAGGRLGDTPLPARGGFYMRDVAAASDYVGLDSLRTRAIRTPGDGSGEIVLSGASNTLELELDARLTVHSDHIRADCEIRDRTGQDRAVTVGFAAAMPPGAWRWWRSIRSSEEADENAILCNAARVEAGIGQISRYPFGCMSLGKDSLILAIPMSEPCVYRISYNGGLRWYTIAFDLGFCPEMGVTRQKFSFLIYRSGGPGGMRAAVKKYYRMFPEYFVKRVEREGNWMAFTKVSSVAGWRDFGFAFHEGDNDIAWDAKHGIYSFRYTEPMSYWMPLAKGTPRVPENALGIIEANLRQTADSQKRTWASATKLCLTEDDHGSARVFFVDAPWCDGALFILNCNPAIPPTEDLPATKASIGWSKGTAYKLYGNNTKPQLAGEYLDSVEMSSAYINCRREHFRYSVRPLSFSRRTKRPAILQILSTYEFASWMAEEVHRRGKFMMANGVPTRYGFMAHLFDVMGIETNWLVQGKYEPLPDDIMDLRRTLCYQKPFCFLMNTDYEKFDHEMVEKYFQRCLFWGMFPSFFSANAATNRYFDNPKLYNRDRDLFKKYVPLIRKIANAGWEPLTMARTSGSPVEVERFGPGRDGSLYFTVRNTRPAKSRTVLRLDDELGRPKSAAKLPEGRALRITSSGGVELVLEPEEVAAVEVRTAAGRDTRAGSTGPQGAPGR